MAVHSLWDPNIGNFPAIVATGSNLTATTDPSSSNDNTQGFGVGSYWFNSTAGALRWWECVSSATGAAVWVFSGANYAAGGTTPSIEVVQFGSGTAVAAAEGNVNRQVPATAINPGAIGVDSVVAVYTLPANSFDISGRGITITAQGSFAATANNKRLKILFGCTSAVVGSAVTGGVAICDTGVVATNGGGWSLQACVYKFGATGSNTQTGLHQQAQVGGAVSPLLAPTPLTVAENAPIIIAVTANTATATSDIGLSFLEVNACN